MKTKQFFEHKVELTDTQIIERAHLIAKATVEINRIEDEKKKISVLRRRITDYSRQIENGYIEFTASGEFHWNTPYEGKVLITPVEAEEFESFTRDMTLQEKQEHSQLEIVFKHEEEEAINPLLQITDEDEYYDPGTFVPDTEKDEEDINFGVQISKENEELQEQEEAILNVDRDKVKIFKSVKNNKYFMFDDFGERLYLTIERMSQSQLYFQDPAVQKGTILKNRKDISLVDLPEQSKDQTSPETPTEPQPLSTIPVYKSTNGKYYFIDEQFKAVKLKVLNTLENVVFLEHEGIEGVILKRHSEVIPGGEVE